MFDVLDNSHISTSLVQYKRKRTFHRINNSSNKLMKTPEVSDVPPYRLHQ